jgi:hypothetical protein
MAILGTALVWLGTAPAQAALVELTVAGEVTEVGSQVASAFTVGQPLSATFTYDSATPAPPSLIPTRQSDANAVTGGGFAIDGYLGGALTGRINMADDDPTLDDQFRLLAFVTAPSVLTHVPFLFEILLVDAGQAAFSTLDLPLALPGLGAFTERSWQLTFTPITIEGDTNAFVRGRLTELEIGIRAVPGPAPWVLLLAGCGALAWRGLRRHRFDLRDS